MKTTLLSCALAAAAVTLHAQQLEVTNETVTSSTLEDSDENPYGSGWTDKVTVRYSFPIETKESTNDQSVVWRGNAVYTYAHLTNNGLADDYNPDDMFSAHLNVMNMRPLGGRWRLIWFADVGIVTAFDDFTARDIVVAGGAVFAYTHDKSLSYGVGAALSTVYGAPIILPVPYVHYQSSTAWVFDINMLGRIQATASRSIGKRVRLNIDIYKIEGMSANIKRGGDWKLYNSTTMKSGVSPELDLGEYGSAFLSAGVAWRRTTSIADRSYKGFFKSFNHKRRKKFGAAVDFCIGYKCTL